MTITVKNLGNGQLPDNQGTLYTAPASTSTIMMSIVLTNTNTTAEVVSLWYLKASGTARALIEDYSIPENGSDLGSTFVFDTKVTMGAGDEILGVSTTASKVD